MAPPRNAYDIMGLTPAATDAEVKKRYRVLALKYHPDKEQDPVKRAQKTESFTELKDAYDRILELRERKEEAQRNRGHEEARKRQEEMDRQQRKARKEREQAQREKAQREQAQREQAQREREREREQAQREQAQREREEEVERQRKARKEQERAAQQDNPFNKTKAKSFGGASSSERYGAQFSTKRTGMGTSPRKDGSYDDDLDAEISAAQEHIWQSKMGSPPAKTESATLQGTAVDFSTFLGSPRRGSGGGGGGGGRKGQAVDHIAACKMMGIDTEALGLHERGSYADIMESVRAAGYECNSAPELDPLGYLDKANSGRYHPDAHVPLPYITPPLHPSMASPVVDPDPTTTSDPFAPYQHLFNPAGSAPDRAEGVPIPMEAEYATYDNLCSWKIRPPQHYQFDYGTATAGRSSSTSSSSQYAAGLFDTGDDFVSFMASGRYDDHPDYYQFPPRANTFH